MGSADEMMMEARQRRADERIASYLGIDLELFYDLDVELEPQTSNDGAEIGYYFVVPDHVDDEALEVLGHPKGATVYLPISLFAEPDEDYEP